MYKLFIQIIIPVFILGGCADADGNETVSLEHEIIRKLLDNPNLDSYFHVGVPPKEIVGNYKQWLISV